MLFEIRSWQVLKWNYWKKNLSTIISQYYSTYAFQLKSQASHHSNATIFIRMRASQGISFCSSFMMNERFGCGVCKITDTPWGLLTTAAFATRRTHRFTVGISFTRNRVLGLQSWTWENRQFLLIQNQSGSC